METFAIIATICASGVTIAWFIRDVKKENSKVLKEIEKGQREGFSKLAEILERVENGNETISKVLERVERGQEKGFQALAEILSKTT